MPNTIQHTNISNETHAIFDDFAATIQTCDLLSLVRPDRPHTEYDDLTQMVLSDWQDKGVLPAKSPDAFNSLDIALASILVVLKKRGLELDALGKITQTLLLPMYDNISILEFATLMCRKQATERPTGDRMPLLVIDGENNICMCLGADLAQIADNAACDTYSHTVLNLYKVLNHSEFSQKIVANGAESFLELPKRIAKALHAKGLKELHINMQSKRIHSEFNNVSDPDFGERIIKYANGRIVSNEVKICEIL